MGFFSSNLAVLNQRRSRSRSHRLHDIVPQLDRATGLSAEFRFNFFIRTASDEERFFPSGIVLTTGRHPPPPRVAGPAEAQLALRQLRLIFTALI